VVIRPGIKLFFSDINYERIRDEGYSRNASCGLNLISTYSSFIINSILIILFFTYIFYGTNLVFTLLDFIPIVYLNVQAMVLR
jgi:hypothetical protein